ncbi:hypothetical protein KIL84_002821 [Mauremys mutica]|uniref:Uncharacterized protein n=1 Tax=Mauremys mutica TaxID=74926 RepID=A0A9D4AQL2_9SAUR|nr:hypothetical protein KIL84_002821 [Mauremys mutica]
MGVGGQGRDYDVPCFLPLPMAVQWEVLPESHRATLAVCLFSLFWQGTSGTGLGHDEEGQGLSVGAFLAADFSKVAGLRALDGESCLRVLGSLSTNGNQSILPQNPVRTPPIAHPGIECGIPIVSQPQLAPDP